MFGPTTVLSLLPWLFYPCWGVANQNDDIVIVIGDISEIELGFCWWFLMTFDSFLTVAYDFWWLFWCVFCWLLITSCWFLMVFVSNLSVCLPLLPLPAVAACDARHAQGQAELRRLLGPGKLRGFQGILWEFRWNLREFQQNFGDYWELLDSWELTNDSQVGLAVVIAKIILSMYSYNQRLHGNSNYSSSGLQPRL